MVGNYNIPKHWEIGKLEDFLDYIQPTEFIVESTEYSDTYKIPVLTAGKSFIKGYTNETKGVFNNLPVIIFDDFTTANKFVNFPFKVKSSAMKILKAKIESSNIMFAFYYMQTLKISTDTHKRYWISVFSKLNIPLPPLPEQQAIVAKIEELLSELDNGKQQLQTAQQQLKVYRQSLLKAAFEGRLVKTGRDLSLGNDLSVKKDGELPMGWRNIKLGEVSNLITKGASPKWQGINYVKDSSQVLFVTSENVRENFIDISKPKYLEIAFNEKQKRSILKKGDVLLNIVGASIGRAAIYNLDFNANINQAVAVIKLSDQILNKFVSYYLNSNKALSYYNFNKVDVARANLSLVDVANIELALPPLQEQQHIVEELESKLTVCDKIEETIIQSLQQAEILRQSILKRAFEGKLV